MNNMSGEVDYRLTKILLADFRLRGTRMNESVINHALIERFKPLLGFLEEDTPFDQTVEDFIDILFNALTSVLLGIAIDGYLMVIVRRKFNDENTEPCPASMSE